MRPHIAGGVEASSGPDAWMSQAMNMLEEGMVKRLRDQRTEDGSGDVAEEWRVTEQVRLNPGRRRRPKSLYLGAKSLLLSKVKRREWRIHWKYGSGGGEWRQRWQGPGKPGKCIGDDIAVWQMVR